MPEKLTIKGRPEDVAPDVFAFIDMVGTENDMVVSHCHYLNGCQELSMDWLLKARPQFPTRLPLLREGLL
jgi:hypothetical protein